MGEREREVDLLLGPLTSGPTGTAVDDRTGDRTLDRLPVFLRHF